MKCLEATDSNGTELYLFQLEGNLFISVPKDKLEFKPLSLEEMKGMEEKAATAKTTPPMIGKGGNNDGYFNDTL